MSCSFTGRLVRLVGALLALSLLTFLPASPASSDSAPEAISQFAEDSSTALMPPRPPKKTEDLPPDALAFDDGGVTDDWLQKALLFAAAASAICAAGFWLARDDLQPLTATGYVGPMSDAPFRDASDDDDHGDTLQGYGIL
ncbi:MAG: hypothetical protein ACR2NL_04175 [Acidimicrobiia bacterium]